MAKHHDFFFVKNTLSRRGIFFLLLLREKVLHSDIPEFPQASIQPHKIVVNLHPALYIINTGLSHRVKGACGGSVMLLCQQQPKFRVKSSGTHHLATLENGIHKAGRSRDALILQGGFEGGLRFQLKLVHFHFSGV